MFVPSEIIKVKQNFIEKQDVKDLFTSLEPPKQNQGLMLSHRTLFQNSKKSLPILKPNFQNLMQNSSHENLSLN